MAPGGSHLPLLYLFSDRPQQLIYGELTKQLGGLQQQDSSRVCITEMYYKLRLCAENKNQNFDDDLPEVTADLRFDKKTQTC